MTEEQPAVVRAQGRPDGDRLPAGLDPHAHTRVHLGRAVLDLPPAGTPLAPTVQLRPMPATPPPLPHPPTGDPTTA